MFSFFIDLDLERELYGFSVNSTKIIGHQLAVLGVREMDTKLYCSHENYVFPWTPDQGELQFTDDYSLRAYLSGCYYLDKNNQWSSEGLTVSFSYRLKDVVIRISFNRNR